MIRNTSLALTMMARRFFYNKVDGNDVEFVGTRSNAHLFKDEGSATFVKTFLLNNGYDAWVETFYVLKEELKID